MELITDALFIGVGFAVGYYVGSLIGFARGYKKATTYHLGKAEEMHEHVMKSFVHRR